MQNPATTMPSAVSEPAASSAAPPITTGMRKNGLSNMFPTVGRTPTDPILFRQELACSQKGLSPQCGFNFLREAEGEGYSAAGC